ncbi:DUF1661 domain-containing protein [Porphyromonas gulae]|nr:DUF1661 domain-containing protein [Porphyromonas gulae]
MKSLRATTKKISCHFPRNHEPQSGYFSLVFSKR